jgi:hypothetical protein
VLRKERQPRLRERNNPAEEYVDEDPPVEASRSKERRAQERDRAAARRLKYAAVAQS